MLIDVPVLSPYIVIPGIVLWDVAIIVAIWLLTRPVEPHERPPKAPRPIPKRRRFAREEEPVEVYFDGW